MEDRIEVPGDENIIGHVMFHEGKFLVPGEVGDIFDASRDQVIETDHFMALGQKAVAEMTPDEAGPSSDQDSQFALPIPSYSNPRVFICLGSKKFLPSSK